MASLFEESLEKWECTANHREDWRENLSRLLFEKGLESVEVSLYGDEEINGDRSMSVKCITLHDGGLYLLGVMSSNALPHVVIGRYSQQMTRDTGFLKFTVEHDPLGIAHTEPVTVQSVVLFNHSIR